MEFLILTLRGSSAELRINVHHIVEFHRAESDDEGAGTTISLIRGNVFTVAETIAKIEVAIRKLNGKLIAA